MEGGPRYHAPQVALHAAVVAGTEHRETKAVVQDLKAAIVGRHLGKKDFFSDRVTLSGVGLKEMQNSL